jgi:hypothetical protein
MGRADLVVPICADKEEVADVRVSYQIFEELEGSRVQPLQVIQEESERMLLPGEDTKEGAEYRLEPVLLFLRGEFRHGRLLADDELELGDEVYDELTVQAHGIPDRVPPMPDL